MTETDYSDIINTPYPFQGKLTKISSTDRAAQFAPFAALTGFDDVIDETGRITEGESVLSDEEVGMLNAKLSLIEALLSSEPTVDITYFRKDTKKEGGVYMTYKGIIKEIDKVKGVIITKDKLTFALSDIRKIDGAIFPRI